MEVMDPWGQQRAASLLCPLSGHLPGHRGDLGDRGSEWSLCTLHTSAPALTPPLLTSPRALLRACGADAMPLRWRFVLLFSLTSYYCLVLWYFYRHLPSSPRGLRCRAWGANTRPFLLPTTPLVSHFRILWAGAQNKQGSAVGWKGTPQLCSCPVVPLLSRRSLCLWGAGDKTLPVTGDEEVEESPKTRGSRATAWLQVSTCPVAGTRLTYSL